jgi:DNA invertase Pin-like site-specific DNA recombinase
LIRSCCISTRRWPRRNGNISIRTKQALAAAKARGVQLGNAEQAKENKRKADRYAKSLKPILVELRHLPVETIAAELTKRKVETPRGGRWHGRTVARLLNRLHLRRSPGLTSWLDRAGRFSGLEASMRGR